MAPAKVIVGAALSIIVTMVESFNSKLNIFKQNIKTKELKHFIKDDNYCGFVRGFNCHKTKP